LLLLGSHCFDLLPLFARHRESDDARDDARDEEE
jgi:hypothetical protein